MTLYLRFIASLAFGLIGLSLVLKVVFERVLSEWDAAASLRSLWDHLNSGDRLRRLDRPEDKFIEAEARKPRELSTRLSDGHRERLRELLEVESRVSRGLPAEAGVAAAAPPAPPPAAGRNPVYDDGWS